MCRSWGLLTDHVVLTVTKYWLRVQLLTVKLVNSDLLITSVMGLPVFGVDLYYKVHSTIMGGLPIVYKQLV